MTKTPTILKIAKVIKLWGSSLEEIGIFLLFGAVSIGMFFFRRNYRLKFEKRQNENKK